MAVIFAPLPSRDFTRIGVMAAKAEEWRRLYGEPSFNTVKRSRRKFTKILLSHCLLLECGSATFELTL